MTSTWTKAALDSPRSETYEQQSDTCLESSRKWFAVFTIPQNEKSAVKHLNMREIESFLPTYRSVRLWKNRQKVQIDLPLFPTYIFVHINSYERTRVLQSPGVVQILGGCKGPLPLPDSEIEFLRSGVCRGKIEPYRELVVGDRVRIRSGAMQGVQGVLVRKNDSFRFVLTVALLNQHAAVEVAADELESIRD